MLAHDGESEPATVSAFAPTFGSSRYERIWILNYLGPFYDKGEIADVLRRVKGGKEANVYCCSGGPKATLELIAAKVYRPRQFRNLRNDSLYRQGREVIGHAGNRSVMIVRCALSARGRARARRCSTSPGWRTSSLRSSCCALAGVPVPQPVAFADNTILMEYIGELPAPAPALHSVTLSRPEAARLFDRLTADVERMLACGLVHADLSAFNVLYWRGDYRIIDFPQAVSPSTHPSAHWLFERDVTRLCQYFERYGIACAARRLAAEIWERVAPEDLVTPPVAVD